jgi:hypothetical protein
MQEEKVTQTSTKRENGIREKLSMFFLNTMFGNVDFIKGEVAKHFDIPETCVAIKHEKTTEDTDVCTLSIYDDKFTLTFVKGVEEPREIKVPKVVKMPKKWYQQEAKTTVIVEKKQTKPYVYWVLKKVESVN